MKTLEEILVLPGDGILCTCGVIFNNEGKVLLGLRHYKKKWEGQLLANSLWTMPGGRTDEGETVGDCLVREAKEEVGLDITPVVYMGEFPGAKSGDILHVFRCEYVGTVQNCEPEKFGEWGWFSVADIPDDFINPHLKTLLQSDI